MKNLRITSFLELITCSSFVVKPLQWLPVLLLFLLSSFNLIGQEITGAWYAEISISGVPARLQVNISEPTNGQLKGEMISLDQNPEPMPMEKIALTQDQLTFSIDAASLTYSGTVLNDKITGNMAQGGNQWICVFGRTPLAKRELERPQTPVPPFPYVSREVNFRNEEADIQIAGTLTLPEGNGPFACAILITGSGQENRDEELFKHKPFAVIADYLTRNGMAVLRCDDRGVGGTGGDPYRSDSRDFAKDIISAKDFLKTIPQIAPKKIGLIGHSEGGLIAPMVASTNADIAFIISLAGPGVSGRDILYKQNLDVMLANGVPLKDAEAARAKAMGMIDIVTNTSEPEVAEKLLNDYLDKTYANEVPAADFATFKLQQISSLNSPWMHFFLVHNAAEDWEKVKCPVLALNGDLDMQVNANQNIKAIVAALEKGKNYNVTTDVFQGKNHLFQNTNTGQPSEYVTNTETFSVDVLEEMVSWLRKNVMR